MCSSDLALVHTRAINTTTRKRSGANVSRMLVNAAGVHRWLRQWSQAAGVPLLPLEEMLLDVAGSDFSGYEASVMCDQLSALAVKEASCATLAECV